jgi:hypothetical protein
MQLHAAISGKMVEENVLLLVAHTFQPSGNVIASNRANFQECGFRLLVTTLIVVPEVRLWIPDDGDQDSETMSIKITS